MAHQCPKCELLFATRNELENHLAVDHESPSDRKDSAGAVVQDQTEGMAPEGVSERAPHTAREPQPSSRKGRGWFERLMGRGRNTR